MVRTKSLPARTGKLHQFVETPLPAVARKRNPCGVCLKNRLEPVQVDSRNPGKVQAKDYGWLTPPKKAVLK